MLLLLVIFFPWIMCQLHTGGHKNKTLWIVLGVVGGAVLLAIALLLRWWFPVSFSRFSIIQLMMYNVNLSLRYLISSTSSSVIIISFFLEHQGATKGLPGFIAEHETKSSTNTVQKTKKRQNRLSARCGAQLPLSN